jgi:hypothetical protein
LARLDRRDAVITNAHATRARRYVTDRLELVIYAYQQGLVKLLRQSNEKG